MSPGHGKWAVVPPTYDAGIGSRCAIGLIALSNDRVCEDDLSDFLSSVDGAGVFTTRIPFAPVVSPESVADLHIHLRKAVELLVPTSHLDVIAFGCSAGSIASGLENVQQSLMAGRPSVKTSNPIEGVRRALDAIGARRFSLLTPYHAPVGDIVGDYFESAGFQIARRATFDLDGDVEFNRLSSEAIVEAGVLAMHPDSDALFISCTGLRTAGAVAELERLIGKPVITSNQALAWDCLRQAGLPDKVTGRGRLLEM